MEIDYKFSAIIEINDSYEVDGLNIWNFYWHCTDRNVEVRDPFEGHLYHFKEYEIESNGKKVNFVAGEFSNRKVGIFTKEKLMVRNLL
ncbi:hypothetical protein [Frigoriflavimonas asaccharolytica]|uniref:Uncharacterized protein n=1 Tax=Frigoriflavimonas asaccharolytica TaxID=2735899 RepID=A0A8J8K7Y5_9FLAO|nr:hypothetical protein [Frigoriflavimonas asaccharolytica]NRS92493.1 hypothetical protein [Frigoriflavimonas asaccharolytica]